MSRLVRVSVASPAAALGLALTGDALAEPNPSADFGQHVAACAQEHLPEGAGGITCSHDGTEMRFENFGAMVKHMQQHDC